MAMNNPRSIKMKRRSIFGITLSAISVATFSLMPGLAQEAGKDGAKGLYFEQLQKPEHTLNTGLRYWIELKRKDKTIQVSNKELFYSGDRIRFHVRPNIDGYAYILLRSGSRGEQNVLFPDTRTGEDNHVVHGRDYELPADGYLTFDQNPGTEKLTLLLSRKPIDAQAFLSKPNVDPTMIASSDTGSKDLIPAKVLIVYAPPSERSVVSSDTSSSSKDQVSETVSVQHKSAPGRAPKKPRTVSAAHESSAPAVHKEHASEQGVVTVVKTDPKGVLFIDIALNHQ
jgi:hypothetical protein